MATIKRPVSSLGRLWALFCSLILFFSAIASSSFSGLRPTSLSLDGHRLSGGAPFASLYLERTPFVSWALELADGGGGCSSSCLREAKQIAYRLTLWLLAVDEGRPMSSIWTSGLQQGDTQGVLMGNEGNLLVSDSDYLVVVEVWSNSSGHTMLVHQAVNVSFHSALLQEQDWSGPWIGGGTQLRGEFDVKVGVIKSAHAYASGVGCFSMSINGHNLPYLFEPGWSTIPSVRLLYRAYEVSSLLSTSGEAPQANAVGVRLGMCTYGYLKTYCEAAHPMTAGCRAFRMELRLTFRDGSRQTISTLGPETRWLATTDSNPIVYTHLYHGEQYNSSRFESDWDKPRFSPQRHRGWLPAALYALHHDLGALTLSPLPPIEVDGEPREAVKVVRFHRSHGEVDWVFDYGQNLAGFSSLKVRNLKPGTRLLLRYTEITNAIGLPINPLCDEICAVDPMEGNCANQSDLYIARGGHEWESWSPSFTYHGFRYLSVSGLPAEFNLIDVIVRANFVHTSVRPRGSVSFGSDDRLLNSLFAAVRYTQLSNLHSIPTDCPQREKRGWLGDALWSSASMTLNFDMTAVYANFLRTMADTQAVRCTQVHTNAASETLTRPQSAKLNDTLEQSRTGSGRPPTYECCSRDHPTFGCDWNGIRDNFSDDNGSLPDVIPYGRKTYGGWPGDPSWGAASAGIPWEVIRHGDFGSPMILEYYNVPKDFVDFMTRHAEADSLIKWGYYGDWLEKEALPVAPVSAFSHAYAVDALSRLALAAGRHEEAKAYEDLLGVQRDAYAKRYHNSSLWGASQSLTAISVELRSGSDPSRKVAMEAMVGELRAEGWAPKFGGVGSRHVLQALVSNGFMEDALRVALRTEKPSYGYMLSKGPGTLWETWDDGGTSFNHPMFGGGLGLFLYQVAGLADESVLPRHPLIRIESAAAKLIRRAQFELDGLQLSWQLMPDDTLNITLTISFGVDATLELPISETQISQLTLQDEGNIIQIRPLNNGFDLQDSSELTLGARIVSRGGSSTFLAVSIAGRGSTAPYRFRWTSPALTALLFA